MMNVNRCLSFVFMFACIFSLGIPFYSYADVATPSDASGSDFDDFVDSDIIDDDVDSYDYGVLGGILHSVENIYSLLASPSNALPDMEESAEGLEDIETIAFSDGLPITPFAVNSLPDHDVVNVKGRFGGTVYTLVVPRQYYANLWVSDSGILYNLSSSNITCRMFTGTTFNDADYNYNLLTLTPMLGNSANNLFRYGSLSYNTYYYVSGSSLTSNTTYGNFYVDDIQIKRSLDIDYRMYYVSLAILFSEGLVVLCFWKNSRQL